MEAESPERGAAPQEAPLTTVDTGWMGQPATESDAPESAQSIAIAPSQRLRFAVLATHAGHAERGHSELAWQQDGSNYEATLRTDMAAGSSVQRSTGKLTTDGLQPQTFGWSPAGDKARQVQELMWRNPGGQQDPLSVLFQLGAMIAGSPAAYPPGATIRFDVGGGDEGESIAFVVQGYESVAISGRFMDTVKVVAESTGAIRRTEVWFAREMAFSPIRIRFARKNGDWSEHEWAEERLRSPNGG